MKEPYGEGVATHTGPESCVVARKGEGEALTGARAGWVLSREIMPRCEAMGPSGCRRRGDKRKATPSASPSQDARGPCAVRDPAHARKHSAREPGDPASVCGSSEAQTASGSPRTHADDARTREVGQLRSTGEAAEQSRSNRRRRRWREGGWPRETCSSATRSGRRAGQTRPARSSGYDKQQGRIGSSGSQRSCTTSTTSSGCATAYLALKRDAAAGVDGETWQHYGENLEGNLRDLSERLKRGAYRAKPVRRAYIPKADGRQRPLGVPALEDKIVQRAVVEVLNAIYEQDFLGFSYGFRPGREPASCAGRADGRDHDEEGELGARRGHS